MSCVMGCLVAVSGAFAQPASTPTQPPADAPQAGEEAAEVRPDSPVPASQSSGDFWFRGEYLLWKVNGTSVPTLVGRIPPTDAELIQPLPGSTITPLFGGSASGIDYGAQSGLRLETGLWIDEARQFGLAVGFFQLEQGQQRFQADSQGQQALGPVFYYGPAFGQEAILMDGVPGLREGTVTVDSNQHLWGTEINAVHSLSAGGVLDHLELLAGFRYLQFSEGLQIRGTSQTIPGGVLPCGCHSLHTVDPTMAPSDPAPVADSLSYFDNFGVHNQFFAPQIGLTAGATYSGFFFEATGKLGAGLVNVDAKAEGATTQQSGATSTTQAGGVLVPPSGLAASADRFAVVPELSLMGGYQLASWCRVTVGYDVLYASDVVRASSLVGPVDVRQVPQLPTYDATVQGPGGAAHLQGSSFWAQGLTAGLEFRY
jgi:hypothetical protein